MPYVITSVCERAGLCAEVCPTDSIHSVEGNADWGTYYINPDTCIDCGACQAECPHDAIYADNEIPAGHEGDLDKNADFFTNGPGKDLV